MSAKTLHQVQQEGLDVLVEKLGRTMQSGSSRSTRPGVVTGQRTGKKSWRKTRIKLSKASWRKGKKFLLREFLYLFLIF